MYRENLELRIILDVFCRQLTVGEERETGHFGICAICHSDFKTSPQTGSLDWARNRRLFGPIHLPLAEQRELKVCTNTQ